MGVRKGTDMIKSMSIADNGDVTLVISANKSEHLSKSGNLSFIAESEGGYQPVMVGDDVYKVSAYVGRKVT
jgi:hypothetical protein